VPSFLILSVLYKMGTRNPRNWVLARLKEQRSDTGNDSAILIGDAVLAYLNVSKAFKSQMLTGAVVLQVAHPACLRLPLHFNHSILVVKEGACQIKTWDCTPYLSFVRLIFVPTCKAASRAADPQSKGRYHSSSALLSLFMPGTDC
jgi:hypothetical protein